MAIFARKHFSQQHAATYSAIIKLAIWIRAFLAILNRFVKRVSLPLADGALLYFSMLAIKNVYAVSQHKVYDVALVMPAFLAYIAVWMSAVWIGGGYDKPLKPLRTLKPVALGTAVILIAYSLLPENLRFSRALILLAMLDAGCIFVINRTLWNLIFQRSTGWRVKSDANVVIVGSASEVNRVKQMLEQIQRATLHVIDIRPEGNTQVDRHELTLQNLEEVIRVHQIDQVIYCARDMSSSDIIASMSSVGDKRVEFKIAPPESLYIIGSGSIESTGDGSMMDVNSVQLVSNRRIKRILDVSIAVWVLLLSPCMLFFQKRPLQLIPNAANVLLGKYTWVAYAAGPSEQAKLPAIKRGILATTTSSDETHKRKMDVLYAKDYRVSNDLRIIWSKLAHLGS
jgi:hypothetical protein